MQDEQSMQRHSRDALPMVDQSVGPASTQRAQQRQQHADEPSQVVVDIGDAAGKRGPPSKAPHGRRCVCAAATVAVVFLALVAVVVWAIVAFAT